MTQKIIEIFLDSCELDMMEPTGEIQSKMKGEEEKPLSVGKVSIEDHGKVEQQKQKSKDATEGETEETVESTIEIITKDSEEKPTETKYPVQTETKTESPKEEKPKNQVVEEPVTNTNKPTETRTAPTDTRTAPTDTRTAPTDKEDLVDALRSMPGMTKSKSQDILKALDEKEIHEIAENLDENKEEKENGSMIDISVVEESDTEKEVQEVIKEADSGFQAEVIEDNEDIEIVPSDNEEVIEYTLEMKHAIPIITVMVAFIAVFFGVIYNYHI